MSDLYVGNKLVGNFRPIKELSSDLSKYKLNKLDGTLFLCKDNEQIRLEPLDSRDKLVINNFSSDVGDLNESIYMLEKNNDIILVILYVYSGTEKLLVDSKKMRIHLLREDEKHVCSDGLIKIKLNSQDEIVPFLREQFINNKSIFVHRNKNDPNTFQMYGKKYRAEVKMERPGVYAINRIFATQNKEYSFELFQIFGDVDFVLWSESIEIQSNNRPLQEVRTNQVFRAWEEYMDFEKELFEDALFDFGFIKYNSFSMEDGDLVFNLEDEIDEEKIKNVDLEFMSFYGFEEEKNIPKSVEDILKIKSISTTNKFVYIGKYKKYNKDSKKLAFDLPRYSFDYKCKDCKGIMYMSDFSLQIEQRRRRKVANKIESKTNESANIIMKLSNKDVVDDQFGTNHKPVDGDVLKKMFGSSDVKLKETYRDAMFIALNTPDIALIQGPPGTGKTTLIKGLITKLIKMNNNYKILVSSEQHEALFNVVYKLSENKVIPPYVSSVRHDEDKDDSADPQFEKNVRKFQLDFLGVCNEILKEIKRKENRTDLLTESIYILQDIRDNNFSISYISNVINKLKQNIILLGYYDKMIEEFSNLNECIDVNCNSKHSFDEMDFSKRNIIRKIEAQRINLDAFFDDGEYQLKNLQQLLLTNEYTDLLLPKRILDELLSENYERISLVFDEYVEYVDKIKDKFIPRATNEFCDKTHDVKKIIYSLSFKLSELSKHRKKDFYEIVEMLMYRLNDIDAACEVIKNYTSIIGSTCAQAEKSADLIDLIDNKYDYVIIDEAARANPLDIMIPMMLGTKVILIGDQKQLPHYIETKYLKKFEQEKNKYANFDKNLLMKSLFQIIFENLETAYKEGRIKFKRTIQLDEQYRMHPAIGSFISQEFYNGTIKNGENTLSKINDYNVFDGKNIVWLNVNKFQGPESKFEKSYVREVEVTRITELIKQLEYKNPNRKLEIGIISYYKGQVELIKQKLKDNFSSEVLENISCDTVDSYQGKEFDIVILSGVRSNSHQSGEDSLGFIYRSSSRINVSLSRAKKLLIVVADESTYRKSEHFRNFIDNHVKKEGYYGE